MTASPSARAAAPRRTRLAPAQRRAQLVELGLEMLATRTLDELSVEDIAQRAGISRGLLFHYFSSKQEFHTEVARAAAGQLLARTEPDPDLPPVEALRGALSSFMDYVAENPDNYRSLVRGASAGDATMRAIFDETRATLAGRIVTVLEGLGLPIGARAELAVHGWVAFAEECVIRSIDDGLRDRDDLLELLTTSLPAVVLAAGEHDIGALVGVLQAARALAADPSLSAGAAAPDSSEG